MKWNEQEGYIKYNTSLQTLRSILGVGDFDIYLRPELAPYITYILSYVCSRLVMLQGSDIKTLIQEVFDIFEYGSDKIIYNEAKDLAREIGISDTKEYIRNEEIPYVHDRFVFSWTNAMTAITQILKLSYSGLFAQKVEDCPCECGSRINTGNENDEWSSGVYPEDEAYDWISGDRAIKVGWSIGKSYIDQCTKCNRK